MYLIIVAAWTLFLLWRNPRNLPLRIYILMLFVTYFYYAFAGFLYWFDFRDGVFLQVDWFDMRLPIELSYFFVYIVSTGALVIFYRNGRDADSFENQLINKRNLEIRTFETRANWLFSIGFICSIYVLIFGSQIDEANIYAGDPLFLVISTFADLQVPAILYGLSRGRYSKKWSGLFIYYVFYAIFVGFRSKMIMLVGPILLAYFFSNKRSITDRLRALVGGLCVVVTFTLMTVARKKFGGLDFDAVLGMTFEDFFYYFFAEANISFGLAAAFEVFGVSVPFAGVTPFYDVLTQWIPRYFYPDKVLYAHLTDLAFGLGNSYEALNSGTSQPYFAEFYAIGGWTFMVVGVLVTAWIVAKLLRSIFIHGVNDSQRLLGYGSVAIFFGYFYFSRGALAPVSKIFIFMVFPYIWLISNQFIYRHYAVKKPQNVGGYLIE